MRYLRIITTVVFVVVLAGWLSLSFIAMREKDDVPPIITSDITEIEVSVKDGPEVLMQGLKASDDKDGDLTDKILIGKQTKFVQKGTTEVTFLVFDESNNVGSFTRTVTYKDYESPKFSLSKPLVYGIDENVLILDRLSATDMIQGNIDDKIKIIASDVNKSEAGVYEMGVEVSNRFGDLVSIRLPVNIVNKTKNDPEILLSDYMVYLKKGASFNPYSYLKQVKLLDGTAGALEQVVIQSDVNTSDEGVYQVVYSYTDMGGRTGCTSLVVVVEE